MPPDIEGQVIDMNYSRRNGKTEEQKKRRAVILIALFAFALAFPFHEAYPFLGEPKWLNWLFPINESLWEHLKLAYYPLLLFWLLPITRLQRRGIFASRVQAASIAAVLSMAFVLFGYYGLLYGFGVEGLAIDIGLLLIGNILGCIHAVCRYTEKANKDREFLYTLASIVVVILFITAFFLFANNPPAFPIFQEP